MSELFMRGEFQKSSGTQLTPPTLPSTPLAQLDPPTLPSHTPGPANPPIPPPPYLQTLGARGAGPQLQCCLTRLPSSSS